MEANNCPDLVKCEEFFRSRGVAIIRFLRVSAISHYILGNPSMSTFLLYMCLFFFVKCEDENTLTPNVHMLRLISINGNFIRKVETKERLTSLVCDRKHKILITGGFNSEIIFRHSFT